MSTPSFPVLFLDIAKGNVRALEQAVATVKSTLAVNPAGPAVPAAGGNAIVSTEPQGVSESTQD